MKRLAAVDLQRRASAALGLAAVSRSLPRQAEECGRAVAGLAAVDLERRASAALGLAAVSRLLPRQAEECGRAVAGLATVDLERRASAVLGLAAVSRSLPRQAEECGRAVAGLAAVDLERRASAVLGLAAVSRSLPRQAEECGRAVASLATVDLERRASAALGLAAVSRSLPRQAEECGRAVAGLAAVDLERRASAALGLAAVSRLLSSVSPRGTELSALISTLKTSWALPDRIDQSMTGFARLLRLRNAVHTAEPYSPPVVELISAELGHSFETTLADDADERDAAAVSAGLNPELISFPTAAYGEVMLAAGFNFRFPPITVPQATECSDLDTMFDPMHWRVITELEQRLRHVVEETMTKMVGSNWIKLRVSQSVRQRWEERKENDRIAGRPVYATIQYADFMDLVEVVGRSDNWSEAFKPIFQNREDFTVSLRRLHPVRKAIAHSRPLGRADVLTLVSEATRIFSALGMRILN